MKTSLSIDAISLFLRKQLGPISDLRQMVEGEESQALSFVHKGQSLVIRINLSTEGFKKDKYAYDRFASAQLPIPRVVQLGQIDENHAFCISEKMPGITFQDVDEKAIDSLLEPITDLWRAIGATDISNTNGFGSFDATGRGHSQSWRGHLLSVIDDYDWGKVKHLVDQDLFDQISTELRKLAESCPEERQLVHGDFGSNNVLVDDGRVTAIIDWENALYGDPFYDVAYVYFWRTWLSCMEESAAYWENELSALPDYHARLRCYQLRIGLHEIYDNAEDGDTKMLGWMQDRCRQILGQN